MRPRVALEPRQYGGGQERERRSGTQDVAGAVGLATALRLAAAERPTAAPRVAALRDRLGRRAARPRSTGRTARVPAGVAVLPGHLHLCMPGVEREELLVALGAQGVCVSGGSSCASGALEPSHVLAAMGVAPGLAAGAVRFTLGLRHDRCRRRPCPRRRARPWSAALRRAGLSRRWHTGPMRVLVAMSGGVDSSVAAALLVEQGHEVVGATLKLWGGASDSGCCSVADVEDARRVAQQLGIDHHVFNLTEEFDRHVVAPYVGEHARGRTPNPCIECNRSMKFDRLLAPGRAPRLRPPGHRAPRPGATAATPADAATARPRQLRRGADPLKDQSYVLSMLGQDALARVLFPVGDMTKDEVRAQARRLGLRTAAKPDSQDVCFIGSAEGREGFLSGRLELHPADVVDTDGQPGRLGARRSSSSRSASGAAWGTASDGDAALRDPRRRGGAPGDRRAVRRTSCAPRWCWPGTRSPGSTARSPPAHAPWRR